MTSRAQDLDQLAAKLRRPPTGLSAFRRLTREQIGRLSDLIDASCARERAGVNAAVERLFSAPAARVILTIMRRAER